MRCPRDQSELVTREYETDVEIDECPKCGGSFLDKGELETIQHTDGTSPASPERGRKPGEKVHTPAAPPPGIVAEAVEPLVDCPKCGVRMDRRRYGLGSDTMIDECPDGCGLWLDGGELEELETLYEKSQEEMVIPITWRIRAAVHGWLHKTAKARS
jgi:Zn-finger nucleic acid-binding protein